VNALIQGAWALLLYHYSSEDDVVFGTVRACRHWTREGAESMIGLFINTLPMRVRIAPAQPLILWLKQIRDQNLALRDHEHTPLPKIQQWSDVPSGSALFESIVVFDNNSLNSTLRAQGGKWLCREFNYLGQTNYPLTLIGYGDAELLLRIEYDEERFDQTTVRHMLGHVRTLLEGMITNVNLPAADLPYLTSAEQQQLLVGWNQTWTGGPIKQCIHQGFEQHVKVRPDNIALVFENRTLSYRELNRVANRVAHRLRGMGVGPDTLVGLCAQRSFELVVGILGILKSGGAYVPLDPAYPKERLEFILKDTQASVLVTQENLKADLPRHSAKILFLDAPDMASGFDDATADENPVSGVEPKNLAYVVYTSGSTGKPKGVLVTHSNVKRLFDATESWFRFGPEDVWTLFHSCTFDFSVWEMWGALFYGGRLVVVPYEVSRSPKAFYKLLAKERVTVLNQTPSAFRQLIQAEEAIGVDDVQVLRLIIFGGETLELRSLKAWINRHGDTNPQLVNMYGITETTVHVTYRRITVEDVQNGQGSVIGVPILDLQVYVLNRNLQPVPIGVPGELYVGGAGLARGYLSRPELTEERFIPNPFNNRPDARLYKTGDIGRYLPNGDLEHLGRADQQIQIRGFRVELGEIETALTEHGAIAQAVAIAREDQPGDQRLIAYFVRKPHDAVNVTALRKHLQTKLPEYMIPQHFVEIDTLPLTQNGKLDRRNLPAPKEADYVDETYVAPRNEVEKIIADIWQEFLNIKKVGVQNTFFDLGGHSLLLVKMLNKLQESFDKELSIVDLFRHPTISTLAKFLTQGLNGGSSLSTTHNLIEKQKASFNRQQKLPITGLNANEK